MDTTTVAAAQRKQLPRFTAHSGWELTDMSVDSTRVAVCAYDRHTRSTSIDLFTLDVSGSTPLQQHQRTIFSREFPSVGDSRWRFRYVSLIDGDSSHIVTMCGSQLDLYNIHSNDDHRTVTYRDGEATCVAVSETGDIYIGLYRSNEVIVFDDELNIIKSITLNGMEGDWPVDITVMKNNLFISTDSNRAQTYNMDGELLNQYKEPDQHSSAAFSITVSSEAGLVFVLWGRLWLGHRRHVVVVFSLADGHSLFSFDVDLPCWRRIRLSSNINRLIAATREGELRVYNTSEIFKINDFEAFKGRLAEVLSLDECQQLGNFFQLSSEHLDTVTNSQSPVKDLFISLEESGIVYPANVNRLIQAFHQLKFNKAVSYAELYRHCKGEETPYERFLAALSSHLTLSVPERLCEYFKVIDVKKDKVTASRTPGLTLLTVLDEMGLIHQFDVSALIPPLRELQLVQAVAKVEEYQSLVEQSSQMKKTPFSTLAGKQTVFIECLRRKIKNWYDTMTPIPWKKSCKWTSSELFVTCRLILTGSKSKLKVGNIDRDCKLQYRDIFTHDRLKSETRIIIEGDPGSGKTMLSSQLAYDWSIGKISEADMVVFLPLRFVEDMTLSEAIKKFYIPSDNTLTADDIQNLLEQASKTYLILDGYEEYNNKTKDGELSEVVTVMKKEKLANCSVVLTSRSDFVRDLPECPMLRLGQFGEEERDLYIANIFPDNQEKQETVKTTIKNSAFLQDLCSSPLLFVFVVHNVEQFVQLGHSGQQERVGAFMQVLVNTLLSQHDPSYREGNQGDRQSVELSEVAFNGLCKGHQQLLWQKSFLDQTVSNMKEWVESGILVVEEGLIGGETLLGEGDLTVGGEVPIADKDDIIGDLPVLAEDTKIEGELTVGEGMMVKEELPVVGEGLMGRGELPVGEEGVTLGGLLPLGDEGLITEGEVLEGEEGLQVGGEPLAGEESRMVGWELPQISEDLIVRGALPVVEEGLMVGERHPERKEKHTRENVSTSAFVDTRETDEDQYLIPPGEQDTASDLEEDVNFNETLMSSDELTEQYIPIMQSVHHDMPSVSGIERELLQPASVSRKTSSKVHHKVASTSQLHDVSLQVKFLHKVIQEWFAAIHFSSMLIQSKGKRRHRVFLNRHLPLINPADLHYVLRFTSYLCPDKCHLIMEHLHSVYKQEDGTAPEYILNCIFLCFAEVDSFARDKRMDNAVRQVCKNTVTILGEDSRLLQQSKVSMLTYASNSKIQIGTLKLIDVIVMATETQLTFNSGIHLQCLPTVKSVEVSRWDQALKKEDYEDLVRFIFKFKLLKEAQFILPSPPPSFTDKKDLSSMKKNLKVEWIIGERPVHTLDKKTGNWEMQFRRPTSKLEQSSDTSQTVPSTSGTASQSKKMKDSSGKGKQPAKQGKKRRAKSSTDIHRGEKISKIDAKREQSTRTTETPAPLIPADSHDQDKSLMVEMVVNKDGGVLTIPDTGVRLEIPPGALLEELLIKMRIVTSYYQDQPSLTFTSNTSTVVELLPNNQKLLKPALLTLPHCSVLKKEEKWKAKVYSSHHKEGENPLWIEQPEAEYVLCQENCKISLKNFSWERIEIGNEYVEGKNIMMYAAMCPDLTCLHVGYYLDLPGGEKVTKVNKICFLHKKPAILLKKGEQPLQISFERTTSPNLYHDPQDDNPKDILYETIAISKGTFCPFVFIEKDNIEEDSKSKCFFKFGQSPRREDLTFALKPNLKDEESSTASATETPFTPDVAQHLRDPTEMIARSGLNNPQVPVTTVPNVTPHSLHGPIPSRFPLQFMWPHLAATSGNLGSSHVEYRDETQTQIPLSMEQQSAQHHLVDLPCTTIDQYAAIYQGKDPTVEGRSTLSREQSNSQRNDGVGVTAAETGQARNVTIQYDAQQTQREESRGREQEPSTVTTTSPAHIFSITSLLNEPVKQQRRHQLVAESSSHIGGSPQTERRSTPQQRDLYNQGCNIGASQGLQLHQSARIPILPLIDPPQQHRLVNPQSTHLHQSYRMPVSSEGHQYQQRSTITPLTTWSQTTERMSTIRPDHSYQQHGAVHAAQSQHRQRNPASPQGQAHQYLGYCMDAPQTTDVQLSEGMLLHPTVNPNQVYGMSTPHATHLRYRERMAAPRMARPYQMYGMSTSHETQLQHRQQLPALLQGHALQEYQGHLMDAPQGTQFQQSERMQYTLPPVYPFQMSGIIPPQLNQPEQRKRMAIAPENFQYQRYTGVAPLQTQWQQGETIPLPTQIRQDQGYDVSAHHLTELHRSDRMSAPPHAHQYQVHDMAAGEVHYGQPQHQQHRDQNRNVVTSSDYSSGGSMTSHSDSQQPEVSNRDAGGMLSSNVEGGTSAASSSVESQKAETLPQQRADDSSDSSNVPKLDRPVDDETLRELCPEISNEWKDIGRNLELKDGELDKMETDNQNNMKEAIYTMLKCWKQKNGKDATFKRLGVALAKAGRKDLQDSLCQRISV